MQKRFRIRFESNIFFFSYLPQPKGKLSSKCCIQSPWHPSAYTNSPPATSFIILSLFFQSFSFPLFFPLGSQCLQLFGCRHGGQKFWHCGVWMPYFHSTACLELWFCQESGLQGPLILFITSSSSHNIRFDKQIVSDCISRLLRHRLAENTNRFSD